MPELPYFGLGAVVACHSCGLQKLDDAQIKYSTVQNWYPGDADGNGGVYNFVTGVLYLPASLVAGALWAFAPGLAFSFGAVLSLAAIVAFVVIKPAAVR